MEHIIIAVVFITPGQADELTRLDKAVEKAEASVRKVEDSIRPYEDSLAKKDARIASLEEQAGMLAKALLEQSHAETGNFNPLSNEAQLDEHLKDLRKEFIGLRRSYHDLTFTQSHLRKEIAKRQAAQLVPAQRKLAEAEAAYWRFIDGLLA